MFRPYKAIIRHHINEEFYPTAHYSNIFFCRRILKWRHYDAILKEYVMWTWLQLPTLLQVLEDLEILLIIGIHC
jgi:hypothetical protein